MKPFPTVEAKRRSLEIFALARYIADNPQCTANQIREGAEAISPSCRTSLFYYLKEAQDNSWIDVTGNTRGAAYRATTEFQHQFTLDHLKRPLQQRSKVCYQEEFMAAYVPNETFYLTSQQRLSLASTCPIGAFDARDKRVSLQVKQFMTDLTHNSSVMEGVKVNMADTIGFLEQNIESRHMSPFDAVILRNHYNAIRYVVENTRYPAGDNELTVCEYETRNIHSLLSDGLFKDKRQQGTLRHEHVEIRDSAYIPSDIPDVISQEFSKMMVKAHAITDPFEQSLFVLVHLPYLQPFDDCNKRTSRLLANVPLLNKGVLPVSWAEVDKNAYIEALMCVYERNSVYGMSEIFVDAFRRSYERFDIALNQRQPSQIEVTYARQIRDAVRQRVLHGEGSTPLGIEAIHLAEFESIVEESLEGIRQNEMVGAPFRLKPADIQVWIASEASKQTMTNA